MLVIKSFWPVMDLDMRTTLCNTGSNPFSLFCQTKSPGAKLSAIVMLISDGFIVCVFVWVWFVCMGVVCMCICVGVWCVIMFESFYSI